MDTSHLLAASATPVVLISACGLITLALYNRLGAILARIRAFHQQKIDLLESLGRLEIENATTRMEMIDSQIGEITDKARMIQRGLCCLLASITAFLICSVLAGVTVLHAWVGMLALGMELLGIVLFLAGLGCAMRELLLSLTPLEEESLYLKVVTAQRLQEFRVEKNLKIAKGA